MTQVYEANIYWSVEGGASGGIVLRRGFLTPQAAEKGARRYVRAEGVLGSVVITTSPV